MSRATALPAPLGWLSIVRLGLVQAALGAVVVLTTSTINRVMVVELALPAIVPGLLVGLHYALQLMRPRVGYGSDRGGRRTPWIVGGIAVLALGGVLAAVATAWMTTSRGAGLALAVVAFLLVGLGVGAGGTSLLALLATAVEPRRRAAAASIVWIMMILGFAVTAGGAGKLLDPFSPLRLVAVSAGVSAIALLVTVLAIAGIEGRGFARIADPHGAAGPAAAPASFRRALAEVWTEPESRRFSIFIFVSMLAYSAQDLILEPFAGEVFGLTIGQSTSLSGLQHGGVLGGMIIVALAGSAMGGGRLGSLRTWTVGGCVASGALLLALAAAPGFGADWPLAGSYFALGLANGAFAAAAIATMMQLAGRGRARREGTRMGLWGAAQAIAFGLGGVAGTAVCDIARWTLGAARPAYGVVFAIDAVLFLAAAALAAGLARAAAAPPPHPVTIAEQAP